MDDKKKTKNLIESLKKELIILYEYSEKPSRYSIEYYSGLDVLENNIISKSYSEKSSNIKAHLSHEDFKIDNQKKVKYKNFQKFQPQNIVRNRDKTGVYLPRTELRSRNSC